MNNKLKDVTMLSFVIHAMIGIRLLSLPRDVVKYASNDAWISVIIVYISASLTGYGFYWIGLKYPGLNFSQINEKVLGKLFGKVMMIAIAIYTISTIGLGLRVFADSINLFLLESTPSILIISIMLIACVYCLRKDIGIMSIILDILLPLLIISMIILVLLPVGKMEPKNILPVFYGGIKPVIKGFLQIVDPVLPCGIVGYVLPHFAEPKKTKKWVFIGISISALVYFLIVLMCIMVFGSDEINYLIFPTLSLTKSIQLRATIFERAESFFMAAWIPTTFTTIILYYFASTLNLKALLNTKKDAMITYAQIPLFFIIAFMPENIVEVFKYLNANAVLAQILNLIYIPLFVLAVFLKTRRRTK